MKNLYHSFKRSGTEVVAVAKKEAPINRIYVKRVLFLFCFCVTFSIYACFDGNPHYPRDLPRKDVVHSDLDSPIMDHRKGSDITSYFYSITLYQDYRGYDSIPSRIKDVYKPRQQRLALLSLRGNRISSVPCWAVESSNDIDLTNNNITVFEPALLRKLYGSLILDSNAISSLPFDQEPPEGICGDPWFLKSTCNINFLHLNYNNIHFFPDSLAVRFAELYKLYLKGNPILPAEQKRIQKLFPETDVRF